MFKPTRCPYRKCSRHSNPKPKFCYRHGTYKPKCRAYAVQRYRCNSCKRSFSRQTFRSDFRDHKPHLNALLFSKVASGVGIRQCAREIHLSTRCTELKLRKIGRHLRRLNLNLRGELQTVSSFHFDELETYEGQRNTRPLSVPVLIESDSRFIVWAESAPIRPRGKMTKKRLQAIEAAENRYGSRKDTSRRSVRRALTRGAELANAATTVVFQSDEKSSYRRLAIKAFGADRLRHLRTNSKLVRATWNPLFAINHEEAIMRDLLGRLRRESWLVSKKRRFLDIALQVHMAYRNMVRRRFNTDTESPAQLLGLLPRRLTSFELLSWRQDWAEGSIHPLSRTGETIERFGARRAAAA